MIESWIEKWHDCVRGRGDLDALLADDVVFYSPIVFTPQKGKDLTKLYLRAAGATFSGGRERASKEPSDVTQTGFHYSKEVLTGHHAILEFETEIAGKFINGVDIITFDDSGQIVEFKVMLRPLQAVNLMHQMMAKMLKQLDSSAT